MGDATSVEGQWKVLDKINIGMFVPDNIDPTDGDFVSMDPFHLRPGNFVDVCVGFDIVSRGPRGAKTVQVHLTIDHILLLAAAEKTAVPISSLFFSVDTSSNATTHRRLAKKWWRMCWG
jgi:hypothetical protein